MACPICCEDFNKSTRKEVTCLKCNEMFCMACVKKYITEEVCACLSCKCEWDEDFLSSVLTRKFMTSDYRALMRKKLFDIETALLPQTMPLAELTLRKKTLEENAAALNAKIKQLYSQRQLIFDEINYCEEVLGSGGKYQSYKPETVSGCPKEDCRGFISRKKWECGLCNTRVCEKCFEILPEVRNGGEASANNTPHVCKQENIDTAKVILKECKPCPKCSAQIFKIDGCDQMFCVQCSTAFSWVTGKVETGRIHNPHYYEWVRHNNNGVVPREPGDGDPCANNQLIQIGWLEWNLRNCAKDIRDRVFKLHQKTAHLQDVVLQNLLEERDNTQLRIDYLLNRIDRPLFEKEIEKRNRAELKKKVIANCINLYISVMIEHFNTWRQNNIHDYKQIFIEEERIRKFTNENLEKLAAKHHFSSKRYFIE